jgi:hypothetical protein
LVAAELYGAEVPVVVLDPADYDRVRSLGSILVRAAGARALVEPAP